MREERQICREIGSRLKLIREKEGLTQEKFAEKLGISFSTYQKYENGLLTVPIIILRKLHEQCRASADYILFGESHPSEQIWHFMEGIPVKQQMTEVIRLLAYMVEIEDGRMKQKNEVLLKEFSDYMQKKEKNDEGNL